VTIPAFRSAIRIVESSDAAQRIDEATRWLLTRLDRGALVVASSRGAADDFARAVAQGRGVAGLHRFSFTELAACLAAPVLAGRGITPATRLAAEAVAARTVFDARRDGALGYLVPVAATPGFPRALTRTLSELLLARVAPASLAALPLGADLAALLERFEQQFVEAGATGRALLLEAAAERADAFAGLPLLLLDVPLESALEVALVGRLAAAAKDTLVTVPFGDVSTLERLRALGTEEVLEPPGSTDLTALRRHLFARHEPPARVRTGEVRLFSAPGEGRECVEIARRILEEARGGVRFDEIGVLVRSPRDYLGLLEDAFDRASIPAWFDRADRRPHPAGRAFLAILSCAVERLSAVRFAEYLSLGQVPDASNRPPGGDAVLAADDLVTGYARADPAAGDAEPREPDAEPDAVEADDRPIVDGMLRAPRRWEQLLVESAVIGGDEARWARRLRGLAAQYARQMAEARGEEPDSPAIARIARDIRHLEHLTAFALPIIDRLAAWPRAATWSEWLTRFDALAPAVLRRPARVHRVLAELRPMGAIGPVTLEEARDVLAERLRTLDEPPRGVRYGRVFVGTPHQARGHTFRVVFVPGLAERLFPQKPREDPLLLDKEMRDPLGAGLPVQEDRSKHERLLLRLAVGAGTDRVWLSYPRIDLGGARPRVPSFYLLDVMRAMTGSIPNHEAVQRDAAEAGGARLDWPAPHQADRAIDEIEHDLATLRELVDAGDRAAVRGHAHYLLHMNAALRRSVVRRWARATSRWRPQDGLVRATDATRPMLALQRLASRPYSVSALQKFATCPYQFALSAIYRLEPRELPVPLQRLDPLTRGAIFHEVQAEFFRALHAGGRLPVTAATVAEALAVLDRVLAAVTASYQEELAPAIERVWRDEVASLARDLRVWVRRLPGSDGWVPEYFEYSFGLSDAGRDPRSICDPVVIDRRFMLRGSVDVIETRPGSPELRITDHKTGRNRTTPRTVIGGGGTLQPVIYGLAVEQALSRPVAGGRLFYCTAHGGFAEHLVPLTEVNRRAGLEALEIIDRAVDVGFLPPAPAERACTWCDFRPVCGPHEAELAKRKPADQLADLDALRRMP
jgi:ATP-dependent helicase/nuclease subunit B